MRFLLLIAFVSFVLAEDDQLSVKRLNFKIINMEDDAKVLYKMLRPEIEIDDIELQHFKGGYINSLVKLDDAKSRHPVVIRTYATKIKNSTDDSFDIYDRKLELAAFEKASELNITTKLILVFSNGFVMDYIDGDIIDVKSFDLEQAKETARRIAKFHSIKLDGLASKTPLLKTFIRGEKKSIRNDSEIAMIDKLLRNRKYKKIRDNLPRFSELQDEFEDLFRILLKKDAFGRTLFCHNDLTLTNIMIERNTKVPFLIDFEKADTNYEYNDLASFFLRLGGVFGKYWKKEDVPNDEFKKVFLRSYFMEWNRLNGLDQDDDKLDKFVDQELRKVKAVMLLDRIKSIQGNIYYHVMHPGNLDPKSVESYVLAMYKDYVKNKRKHLKLLDHHH